MEGQAGDRGTEIEGQGQMDMVRDMDKDRERKRWTEKRTERHG